MRQTTDIQLHKSLVKAISKKDINAMQQIVADAKNMPTQMLFDLLSTEVSEEMLTGRPVNIVRYAVKLEYSNIKIMQELFNCLKLLPSEQIAHFFISPGAVLYDFAEQCDYAMITRCSLIFVTDAMVSDLKNFIPSQLANKALSVFKPNNYYIMLKVFMLKVETLLQDPNDQMVTFEGIQGYFNSKDCSMKYVKEMLHSINGMKIIKFNDGAPDMETLIQSIRCRSKDANIKSQVVELIRQLKHISSELTDIQSRIRSFIAKAEERIKQVAAEQEDEKSPASTNSFVERYKEKRAQHIETQGMQF